MHRQQRLRQALVEPLDGTRARCGQASQRSSERSLALSLFYEQSVDLPPPLYGLESGILQAFFLSTGTLLLYGFQEHSHTYLSLIVTETAILHKHEPQSSR